MALFIFRRVCGEGVATSQVLIGHHNKVRMYYYWLHFDGFFTLYGLESVNIERLNESKRAMEHIDTVSKHILIEENSKQLNSFPRVVNKWEELS